MNLRAIYTNVVDFYTFQAGNFYAFREIHTFEGPRMDIVAGFLKSLTMKLCVNYYHCIECGYFSHNYNLNFSIP